MQEVTRNTVLYLPPDACTIGPVNIVPEMPMAVPQVLVRASSLPALEVHTSCSQHVRACARCVRERACVRVRVYVYMCCLRAATVRVCLRACMCVVCTRRLCVHALQCLRAHTHRHTPARMG